MELVCRVSIKRIILFFVLSNRIKYGIAGEQKKKPFGIRYEGSVVWKFLNFKIRVTPWKVYRCTSGSLGSKRHFLNGIFRFSIDYASCTGHSHSCVLVILPVPKHVDRPFWNFHRGHLPCSCCSERISVVNFWNSNKPNCAKRIRITALDTFRRNTHYTLRNKTISLVSSNYLILLSALPIGGGYLPLYCSRAKYRAFVFTQYEIVASTDDNFRPNWNFVIWYFAIAKITISPGLGYILYRLYFISETIYTVTILITEQRGDHVLNEQSVCIKIII